MSSTSRIEVTWAFTNRVVRWSGWLDGTSRTWPAGTGLPTRVT